jgi:hypothetical protein
VPSVMGASSASVTLSAVFHRPEAFDAVVTLGAISRRLERSLPGPVPKLCRAVGYFL